MNLTKAQAPVLCPASQCKIDLDFMPLNHWPQSLPAVAVNGWILAGFSQDLVFNHILNESAMDCLPELFHSLHPRLSLMELARLWTKLSSPEVSWFPWKSLAKKYDLYSNVDFEKWANILLKQPIGFQSWSAEKRVSLEDLKRLPSLGSKALQFKIVDLGLNKHDGLEVLQICHDLQLKGHSVKELLIPDLEVSASDWLIHLRVLHNPQLAQLTWPQLSQIRWVQHQGSTGLELKLFVTEPTGLKKHATSDSLLLDQIQDLLETTHSGLWKTH
jgi:hypothetical protein